MMNKLFVRNKFVSSCINKSLFFSTKPDIHEIIATQLGLNDDTFRHVFKKKIDVNDRLSEQQIVQNCCTLKKLMVDLKSTDFLMDCLKLRNNIMTNRIQLMEEFGVKTITLEYIAKFPRSMRKTIYAFKKLHKISREVDIGINIFNSIEIYKVPYTLQVSDKFHMSDYYLHCMAYYKNYILKLCHVNILKPQWFKYQSFRQLKRLMNIYKTELQLDNEFIIRNPFLLHYDLDNIVSLLNTFKDQKIAGLNFIEVVKKYPRILYYNVSNTKELLNLFDQYNVPDNVIRNNLSIFQMNKTTFKKRYDAISNHSEFVAWLKHSKIFYTLKAYNATMDRVNDLQHMNVEGKTSFYALYCSRNRFARLYMSSLTPRSAKKKYLKNLFKQELEGTGEELVDYITRHPHWKNVPISSVHKMLVYLKQRYSDEDIISNLHLTLYPKHVVDGMLSKVYNDDSLQKDCTDSQRLALCLYMMEELHHFSGDAIWNINETKKDSCELNEDDVDESDLKSLEQCTDSYTRIRSEY